MLGLHPYQNVIAIALHRLKEITLLEKTLIPEALQSLKQVKKLRHPYSKALAQVRLLSYSPLFKFHIQVHLVLALHISCVFINIWKCIGWRHNCRGLCKGRRPRTSTKALRSINSGSPFSLSQLLLKIFRCQGPADQHLYAKEMCMCKCIIFWKVLLCCRSSRSCTTRNTSPLHTS